MRVGYRSPADPKCFAHAGTLAFALLSAGRRWEQYGDAGRDQESPSLHFVQTSQRSERSRRKKFPLMNFRRLRGHNVVVCEYAKAFRPFGIYRRGAYDTSHSHNLDRATRRALRRAGLGCARERMQYTDAAVLRVYRSGALPHAATTERTMSIAPHVAARVASCAW